MSKRITLFLVVLSLFSGACFHEQSQSDSDSDDSNQETADYGKNTLNQHSPLAINVAAFNAWTPGWVLIDLFPKAQNWVSNLCDSDTWGSGPTLSLDDNGWVETLAANQCVDTSVMMNQAGHYPAGTYVVLWEGDGALSIRWDIEPEVSNQTANVTTTTSGLKRMTFDIEKSDQTDLGIGIRIASQESEYIKNIRLIPPGGMCGKSSTELNFFAYCESSRGGEGQCAAEESCFDFEDIYWDRFNDSATDMNKPKPVFHPLYAQSYQHYRSIRYMKWTRAEESHDIHWSDRVAVNHQPFTDAEKGLPYEYMTAFSNLINANMYIAVPMKSSDSYHNNMSAFINQHLNKDLTVFVEYGNEIFNAVQPLPHSYAIEQAETELGMTVESDYVKSGSWAGYRSAQIFDTWRAQLGADADRFVGVLVGFNPIREYTDAVLDYNNSYLKADALAINGYIGPSRTFVENTTAFDALNLEALLTEIDDGSAISSGSSIVDLNTLYLEHAALATEKGLELIAYEGGNFMELDDAPQATIDVFFAANRDSRLGEAFVENIENFIAAGGRDFFFFLNEDLWNDEGAFGARQFQDQTRSEAPTFDKLTEFIETTNCSWIDCALPSP